MRLHVRASWLPQREGSVRLPSPRWWRRLTIARLRNPLDQFIVTIELIAGAVIAAVGAAVVAATAARWPWTMVVVGLAIVAIALSAILRAGGEDGD